MYLNMEGSTVGKLVGFSLLQLLLLSACITYIYYTYQNIRDERKFKTSNADKFELTMRGLFALVPIALMILIGVHMNTMVKNDKK